MPRLPTLFAIAAVAVLLGAQLPSRFNLETGMSFTLPGATHYIPNTVLCYAAAAFFTLFAFLYSVPMVRWNPNAGMWHFGLSILSTALFFAASLAMDRITLGGHPSAFELPSIVVVCISPVLFLLVQAIYLFDGLRRTLLPLLRS